MAEAVRVEVKRKGGENAISLVRRFSRRVQGAAIIRTVRNQRTFARALSKNVQHKKKMNNLEKRARYEELVKLGKIDPTVRRKRKR